MHPTTTTTAASCHHHTSTHHISLHLSGPSSTLHPPPSTPYLPPSTPPHVSVRTTHGNRLITWLVIWSQHLRQQRRRSRPHLLQGSPLVGLWLRHHGFRLLSRRLSPRIRSSVRSCPMMMTMTMTMTMIPMPSQAPPVTMMFLPRNWIACLPQRRIAGVLASSLKAR